MPGSLFCVLLYVIMKKLDYFLSVLRRFWLTAKGGVALLFRRMGKSGDEVSILGYGCMRFPRVNRRIDEQLAGSQVIAAIEQGVNYFDTAYIYPQSEEVLGKILAQGYRSRVMIATKLPPFLVHSQNEMEAVLGTQLRRLQTDYIDYYLMHALSGLDAWQRLKELGVEDFLKKAHEAGKIGRIGFSYHGDTSGFQKIVDDYPWDFCQIQYNYMDENTQAGKAGLEYAAAKGLGVVVMEPLRGGFLANKMPAQAEAVFQRSKVKRTPAEWALRWVWDHPQVTVLLSGMNEDAQIEENIRIAGEAQPNSLGAAEHEIIRAVRGILSERLKVGCTGCGYCLPCPAGVNIPMCFTNYNDRFLYQGTSQRFFYMLTQGGADGGSPSFASLCQNCGRCERSCPQGLPIRQHLKEVAGEMESFYFKPAVRLLGSYYKLRKRFGRKNRDGGT